MNAIVAEFIGTALLILFGNGVVANVVLSRTKGNNSGWMVITAGWAVGVFVGVFVLSSSAAGTSILR
jgi:glycerol uptake facilitator protein